MKTLNRCALAALALVGTSAAFAQSSVTLYGRVNTTFEHQKTAMSPRPVCSTTPPASASRARKTWAAA